MVRVRHSFSRQHLRAARLFAERAGDLEAQAGGVTKDEELKAWHRAYVAGAIISAVAGLEASINELYLEAYDGDPKILVGVTRDAIRLMAELWKDLERKPILQKYQIALVLAGRERVDEGAPPFQDASSLVKLRDALVHYKPEWDAEPGAHGKLQKRLRSSFPENPLVESSSLWFPHRCLGSGCAKWAVLAAELFLTQFWDRLGIPGRT